MMLSTGDRVVSEVVKRFEENRKNRTAFRSFRRFGQYHPLPLNKNSERVFHKVVPNNSWQGQRCFIIGGGKSLKDFDFSRLKNELTIGVNRAYERFDCTILFSMDTQYLWWVLHAQFGKVAKAKFENFKGYKVWLRTQKWSYPKGIYLLNSLGGHRLSYSMEQGLGTGANSGFAALNLAVCLGANPIYLLGFDMKGEKGRQAWWHNGYPYKRRDNVYRRFKIGFQKVAPELEAKGIKVINLNRNSALKCFEFGDFDSIKPFTMPVFISYYTKGTGYVVEAKRLEASLRRFNLEYDIEAIDNLGSWQKNTHYKAQFIKKMLLKHGRPVVFVDADARILRYPFLFRDFGADIAAHFRDYARFSMSTRKAGKELLSGTLYVANNETTLSLLTKWIEVNRQNPAIWEQKILQRVLGDFKGDLKELPAQYCKIYDIMRAVENPVIEHYQASRRLRHKVGV